MTEKWQQSPAPSGGRRWKRIWHITAWVLGIIFFSKVDNILWGYVGQPSVNMASGMCFGLAGLFLMAAILVRILGKKWIPGMIVALLVFLAFEPLFPSPDAMHLLGYSIRVKEKLDIPAVRAWTAAYSFPEESSSTASQPAYTDDYHLAPLSVPRTLWNAGYWFSIRRSDRTSTAGNGGGFMDPYGVTIGPAARQKVGHWSIFEKEAVIKLDDDVYVWCEVSM